MSRYDGKPFLRLLDAYVLRAIGELDAEHERSLVAMEPKLREVFAVDGKWAEIVAVQMAFPSDLPSGIQDAWERTQVHAAENGVQADPLEFTRTFVDENFPN